jgi:glycosyltransferase involved in cell wall biosynthesis
MEFSLILGTLNRNKELQICLNSLKNQLFKDFELIIVDQSDNDLTQKLVQGEEYSCLNIIYNRVNFRGLSKARNYALNLANGRYFALIDDDASYDQQYLMRASQVLKDDENTILSGYIKNPQSDSVLKDYSHAVNGQELTMRQIIRMTPSPALIFPYSFYQKGARFDENFGVGARYGACEETDLILQYLDLGCRVKFDDTLLVLHPTMQHSFELENNTSVQKKGNYACGLGALIAKDIYVRKNNRLGKIKWEKLIKLAIKKMGFFGERNKYEAQAEWEGFCHGFKEYIN